MSTEITLHATPYNISAVGFYFSNQDEFEEKFEKNFPVEEYEIQFIDGPDAALELFKAMKVLQCNLGNFFDSCEQYSDDEVRLAGICHLMMEHGYEVVDEAAERLDELSLFEGTLEDYTYNYAEDCIFTKDTPKTLREYFDYKAFARDIELNGDASEFDFCGKSYVICGI